MSCNTEIPNKLLPVLKELDKLGFRVFFESSEKGLVVKVKKTQQKKKKFFYY